MFMNMFMHAVLGGQEFFFFSFLKYSHGCQSASFQNINTKAVFRILTKAYSCHCNFETGFLLEKVRFYIIFVLLQKRESWCFFIIRKLQADFIKSL